MSPLSWRQMNVGPPYPGEEWRLEALRKYTLLDALPEKALDDLTRLAAAICGAPMAVISLVDADRQQFISRVGVALAETPREISFCTHALHVPELLIVPDAAQDERFAKSPLVTGEMGVRFYAGARLLTPDGAPLGTLCIFDRVPRELQPHQQEALKILSREVMSQLELRRHALALAASEERLRMVTENARVGLVIVDRERRYVYANSTYAEILGMQSEPIVGRRVPDLLGSVYEEQIRPRLDRAFAGERVAYELCRQRGDREVFYAVRCEPMRVDGEVPQVVVVITDLTERKQAEVVSFRLATIVESSEDAIIGKDLNSIITSWNKGAEKIFGYSAEEMIGTSILRLIPEGRRHEEDEIIGTIRRGDVVEPFETLRRTKEGKLVTVSVSASPVRDSSGKIIGVSKVARDMTERKRGERTRRLSEARYRTLFDYAPDGILIADSTSRYLDANPNMCRMLGYTREELIGLHAADIVAETEVSHIGPALKAIESKVPYEREWLFRRKDGSQFQAEVMATLMPDGTLLAMVRDITERRRIEARFRRLVDSNAQGVMFWNAQGEITEANDAFLKIVGYTREDFAAGQVTLTRLTPPGEESAQFEEVAATGVSAPHEEQYVRKDGTLVPVLVGAAAFEDAPQEGVCFVLDLTERKKLEQQFLRAQRMESIGTLAGGIAHDLNNILGPIMLSLNLLEMHFPDKASQHLLAIVGASAKRGADMVKQVLSFARGVGGDRMEVQVRHVVQDIEKIVFETFPKNIKVQTVLPRDLWLISGDPTQLHQVLLNLCVNARDAMPDGGSLTISAQNMKIDAHYAGLNLEAKPGPYVVLQVEDTGTGMPPEILEKIFDPFFTTKEIGKGTGLGLSTSLAIVKSHGGFIRAYSEAGRGTQFKIYLPALTEHSRETAAAAAAEMPRGNGELVLVVDDEASVRHITQRTLEAFGYRVLLAADGAEALAVYSRHIGEIAVVLTDMMMPVLDGAAIIQVLLKLNPKLPIIAASGLPSNDARATNLGVRQFLSKPYTADHLLKALKQVLNGAS